MSTQTIFALILFVITYVLMFTMQKLRPYVAVISACIFVAVGSLGVIQGFSYTVLDALKEIDWNVLLMISGTMGTVFFFIESGMPDVMSDMVVSRAGTVRLMVLAMSLFAGIVSAFVDNVATVLMIAPVALAVCRSAKISPVPVIICIAISSNLQGAATLVGDTTSILLAKQAEPDLDFMDFFFVNGDPGMFWITEAGALAAALIILWMFRHDNTPIEVKKSGVLKDKVPGILLGLTIISLIAASAIPYKSDAAPGQIYKPEISNGIICMFYFLLAVIHQYRADKHSKNIIRAFEEIDFYTLTLLCGLFVIIGGIERAGVIDMIGAGLASLSGDGSRASLFMIYTVIVWMSVAFSAVIDNIPYTATMLPVAEVVAVSLSAAGGIEIDPNLFYFGLMAGATLGGNITPIGASANITGIGILRKNGYEVKTWDFMRFSIPFTLAAVTTAYILIWIIYS
ncbi:MAG: SLC13 family permease [Eubacteriales bacterium]|nr:SLC13 family permease [Eubacteriales bacterium]